MIIGHFLNWVASAKVDARAAAAAALARAFLSNELGFEDRCGAEAAMTLLLDDPSSKVRQSLAEALSMSPHAPPQVVAALAADQRDVAAPILMRSPLLSDLDLIELLAGGDDAVQCLIAARPRVSMALAAAVAEIGGSEACLTLLANDGADIATLSYRRMAERFGQEARLRSALLGQARLPADSRHMLMVCLSEALGNSPFVSGLMGAQRARRLAREACIKACVTLIDAIPAMEHAALVEHLRLRGELTTNLLVRAAACGKIDFLGAALVALAGQDEARVTALLAHGRDGALDALMARAGLEAPVRATTIRALHVWREVASGKTTAGVQEVSWLMLREIEATPGQRGPAAEARELAALVKSIHLDALRDNARLHALAIAAA
jgi:uncharacterized protein (DUF2336 family)